jgi:hypothetical protein
MRGQLIHESVLSSDLTQRMPKALLPYGWNWDVEYLRKNKRLEPDPYISAESLLSKLTTAVLNEVDRGVLTTLSSSGKHPPSVSSMTTSC